MRIVYYTSGLSGVGRLVHGMAIGNGLKRKKIRCDFTILHSSALGRLADDFDHVWIPFETDQDLSEKNFRKSVLYKTLRRLSPDILIVNHSWFMLFNFIREMECKKIYISDQASEEHFKIPLQGGDLIFESSHYDMVLAIEPFECSVPMGMINPLIIKNREEILTRHEAMRLLRLDGTKKVALYSFSGNPGDFGRFLDKYSYLEKEGYEIVRSSTHKGGLFPAANYYNAFDLIVCGAGYNQVWEAVYFEKKAIFEPLEANWSDQQARIKTSSAFRFDINGADQLADIIMEK